MEKILSQDEVDALLKGLSDGEIEGDADVVEDQGTARQYDLTNQDRIIRGRMPTLEIINDRFARLHRITLSSNLRRIIDLTTAQTEMIKFGEFIRTLPVPTSLHVLKMEPMRGHTLLVLESKLIFNLLDCFFGGTGKSNFKIEGRDFTSIENRVVQKLVNAALDDLSQAWKPVADIDFQYVRSEVNPQFATIVPPSDIVITVRFELELDRIVGRMILCLPYSTIEPIRSRLYASYQSDQLEVDVRWVERLKKRIQEVMVELTLELGKTTIKGRDLLQLDVGDVLVLNQDIEKPLVVKIENIPKLKAFAGTHKGSKAIQVQEVIASSNC
ncbi:flagellar motor switch protein FliM [Desulfoferrobacter suflitae]|uniref:flagellar motor switch protein FliM n=1 Tax=Desulfoferrobacter suflitae TaxID=2865782 RepID=UPI0021649E64|nr:flagellar motor switch protein FliM [Desulfoferrobacter suflitae]MCK8602431.1 flagellar motor switch protein FliM [Desulfoferrobacter suflitae]